MAGKVVYAIKVKSMQQVIAQKFFNRDRPVNMQRGLTHFHLANSRILVELGIDYTSPNPNTVLWTRQEILITQ